MPADSNARSARVRARSTELTARLSDVVPGGAHTYAKGDDQYPEGLAPVIARGRGSHVWDVDGNDYIEYGSGLRAVSLGHAHPRVVAAVARALDLGSNFVRPAAIEVEAAERFLATVGHEMVKFAKNGSDATTAAVRLARAATGRDLVGICLDQPFFSTDDWFIGGTPMPAGIPTAFRDLTVGFHYNDLESVRRMFADHPGEVACLILEPAGAVEPAPGFLEGVRSLCDAEGALLVFDEMITGFRWSVAGAQHVYGVRPDLAAFGKAMGNGFAIAALVGPRELMELGGIRDTRERVFLLSTTHGAETHALAAMLAVLETYESEAVIERLDDRGRRLAAGVCDVIARHGLDQRVLILGRPCNLVFATLDADGNRSQAFRTLFLQELIERGVIGPSFVVSAALSDEDIERTVEAVDGALTTYARALADGVDGHLRGRPVKPVFRPFA
ncbi:MAG: glutamate-1-semialdehyde 2,1-aminomutase [Chloroflexota bacterium]